MKRDLRVLAAAGSLLLAFSIGEAAYAQKPGGTLKMYFFDSPASMSIHEEATVAAQGPMELSVKGDSDYPVIIRN
jgi:hypothetical protein